VIEVRDGKVRLGIVAPKETPIHRQEIFDQIHKPAQEPSAAGSSAK
jgi:carbon storage regulator CsrA